MTFYNTFVTYNGNGSTTDFSVPFSYLDQDEVIVTFSGPTTYTFTFPSSNIVRTSPALASGESVTIRRRTGIASINAVFVNGSPVLGAQLNNTFSQLLYGLQEASDSVSAAEDAAIDATTAATAASAAATSATSAANAALAAANDATNAVVADNSITAAKLTSGSVTTPKLLDANVTTAKLADGAVTTAKLGDDSVSTVKLNNASVTTAKLADSSVSIAKINASGTANNTTYLRGDGAWGVVSVDLAFLLRVSEQQVTPVETQTFDATGTWNKPASGSVALIEVWGGGGGGGRGTNIKGGTGGQYRSAYVSLAYLPSTVSVTVGTGGASRTTSGNGNNGTASSFGSYITASGGLGGSTVDPLAGGSGGSVNVRGTTNSWPALTPDLTTSENGGNIDSNNSPNAQSTTRSGAAGGNSGAGFTVAGTSTYGGNGGAGASTGSATNGAAPGGGGGACSTGTGAVSGAGGNGRVRVTVF